MKKKSRYFGSYGGRYVPEMLIPALEGLEKAFFECKKDSIFQKNLENTLIHYCGRPTPLTYAKNLTQYLKGCKIYLKNEGLNHTGSHKINNALGQGLLTQYMNKKKIVAETGAGQHGVACATVAAKLNFDCFVFMGEIDIKRQYPNVYSMKTLGTQVYPVTFGTKTLKDAVNAALKYWIENLKETHYILGSALGPHPYPMMVRDFQSIIGKETKKQILALEGRLPDAILACVGGGSNSLGIFYPFLKDKKVKLIGVEAGGIGKKIGQNAARFQGKARVGIAQGYKSYFLQNKEGQLEKTHSIAAGLDYAGVGPELAYLKEKKRVSFFSVSDKEVINAFKILAKTEGIFPALESAHGVAQAIKIAPKMNSKKIMIINISGRGDKDIFINAKATNPKNWFSFLQDTLNNES